MAFRLVTRGLKKIRSRLLASSEAVETAAKSSENEIAQQILNDVRATAPVDSGSYRDDWRIEERDGTTYLVNSQPHAIYLVLPNSRFVGASGADDPGTGVYHNVRGIVFKYTGEFPEVTASKIQGALDDL